MAGARDPADDGDWGDLDERLERKKRLKLRRQQRELQRQQRELEALERERRRCEGRCREMAAEDALSRRMMAHYANIERRQIREREREDELRVFGEVAVARQRARALGLPLSTPGAHGRERLAVLQGRIAARERGLRVATEAHERLEDLPRTRRRLRSIMQAFFTSSLRRKVERAVADGNSVALVELLDPQLPGRRADPRLLHHESANGLTPVLGAIFRGELSALRRLLELGASPDHETSWGMTPLLAAIMTDDVVALHLLLEFRASLQHETRGGVRACHLAADKGRVRLLRVLLRQAGVDVNAIDAAGRSALHQAVISQQYEAARTLLAFGADKELRDQRQRTPLDWARQLKSPPLMALLSATTASSVLLAQVREEEDEEANAINSLATRMLEGRKRGVVLERALREANLPRIRELLALEDPGYGPNYETPCGLTPLLVMAKHGTVEDLLYCLEHKCTATHANRHGLTALMAAAYFANTRVLEVLIAAGCSLLTRDFTGKDTMRHLHDLDHSDMVQELCSRLRPTHVPVFALGSPVEDMTAVKSAVSVAVMTREKAPDDGSRHEKSPRDNDASDDDRRRESTVDTRDVEETDADSVDDTGEDPNVKTWSLKRRVLRRDRTRNIAFEKERDKIRHALQKGRRNGLIAPMRRDPQGKLAFTLCENCRASRATKRCFLCEQVLCDPCQARLHELPHRRHHQFEELNTLAITPVNHHESLAATVAKTLSCVTALQETMTGCENESRSVAQVDPEVDKYNHSLRIQREKSIMRMEINVPVAAAKHAAKAGDTAVFENPSDIELADLYIAQNKMEKARTVLDAIKPIIDSSLGYRHPTMLRITLRQARVELMTGDAAKCVQCLDEALGTFESLLAADHKDLVSSHELKLQALDNLALYQDAVNCSRRILHLRRISLPHNHSLVKQASDRIDEFVAKREQALIAIEDQRVIEQCAMSREREEHRRKEAESRCMQFRSLLLEEQDGYDDYVAFARREFAEDMVQFWIAVEKSKLLKRDPKAFRAAVVTIFLSYIKSRRIKIVTAVQRKRMKKLITTPGKKVPLEIFDEVHALVFDVIYHRVYARFCVSRDSSTSIP